MLLAIFKEVVIKNILVLPFLLSLSLLFGAVADPEAPVGSRKNPVPIGEKYELQIETGLFSVGVVKVMRGFYAELFVDALNGPPLKVPTNERMLFSFSMEYLKDLSSQDAPVAVGDFLFDIANSGYNRKHQEQPMYIEGITLSGNLYEGGSHTGALLYEVDPDREYYLILKDVWFELGADSSEGIEEYVNSL